MTGGLGEWHGPPNLPWLHPILLSPAAGTTLAPPLLLLQNTRYTLGGATALLDGAELSVSAGERICLVGRNGSGKSTLLRVAAGLIEPALRHAASLQPGATIRYLPQEPDFAGYASTLEYVEAGLGDAAATDHYRAAYLLEPARSHRPRKTR